MKLSVIIPCYNEKSTLLEILDKVRNVNLGDVEKEIVLIDDFSTDGTRDIIKNLNGVVKIFHEKNKGKGAGIKSGIKVASGDLILVQDADLEYDPNDYVKILEEMKKKNAKVLYGSRTLNKKNRYSHLHFLIGGKLVTMATNLLYFSRLTDEPTCYKVFDAKLIKGIEIKGNEFEWEPEITAKILKKGIKIHEIPISYFPRRKDEGKKINWKDGVQALWTLFYYRFND